MPCTRSAIIINIKTTGEWQGAGRSGAVWWRCTQKLGRDIWVSVPERSTRFSVRYCHVIRSLINALPMSPPTVCRRGCWNVDIASRQMLSVRLADAVNWLYFDTRMLLQALSIPFCQSMWMSVLRLCMHVRILRLPEINGLFPIGSL